MSSIGSRLRKSALPVCLALGGFVGLARADTLTAKLYGDNVLLYELIVVRVELHLDDAFLPPEVLDDPYEANRQLWRLRRRLRIELRRPEGEKVCDGILPLEFPRPTEPVRVLANTGFAFLGRADPKTDEFHHWAEAGIFKLVVVDEEHGLKSNEMSITLEVPPASELEASRLFKECGLDAIAPLLGEQPQHAQSIELLHRLGENHVETVYGKYATASLALCRSSKTRREHNDKGGREVWEPVADELARAAKRFEPPHPVLAKLLFELATAQGLAGQRAEARQAAETLSSEFPDTEFGRKAKAMLAKSPD